MGWELAQHNGFERELSKVDVRDADKIRAALHRLKDQLDRLGTLDPRKVFSSAGVDPGVDLQPLHSTGIPGSYRLRVGRHRVALAILPDEQLVLLTAVARRDDSTYAKLPQLHRKRFADR
jgi:mRNA-degrading endonuclease RelE of RelBE toxin-antitoxin system